MSGWWLCAQLRVFMHISSMELQVLEMCCNICVQVTQQDCPTQQPATCHYMLRAP
jgi:hypothetical protein